MKPLSQLRHILWLILVLSIVYDQLSVVVLACEIVGDIIEGWVRTHPTQVIQVLLGVVYVWLEREGMLAW